MPADVTYRSKGKDIELPAERKRDPRLPKAKPSVRGSLDALRNLAKGAKKNADDYADYTRRNR